VIENLTKEMFSDSLHTTFRLETEPARAMELQLVQLSEGVSSARQEQFSLLFRGPLDHFLPQKTYHLEHEKLGDFDLFLVPVGREQDGFRYEAVFNRFRPES
jgi:uncharacterized protein DUF6916